MPETVDGATAEWLLALIAFALALGVWAIAIRTLVISNWTKGQTAQCVAPQAKVRSPWGIAGGAVLAGLYLLGALASLAFGTGGGRRVPQSRDRSSSPECRDAWADAVGVLRAGGGGARDHGDPNRLEPVILGRGTSVFQPPASRVAQRLGLLGVLATAAMLPLVYAVQRPADRPAGSDCRRSHPIDRIAAEPASDWWQTVASAALAGRGGGAACSRNSRSACLLQGGLASGSAARGVVAGR